MHFEEYNQKALTFLSEVAKELHTPEDIAYADRLTRAVLAVTREMITTEESLHFISSLPMYLKAIYVSEWKIHRHPIRLKTREEFFQHIREKYPRTTGRPLGNYQSLRNDIQALLKVLRHFIVQGEIKDIKAQLPKPIADLWEIEENNQSVKERELQAANSIHEAEANRAVGSRQ